MLITFEGGEGTGKTTLINLVEKELRRRDLDIVATREPGGSLIAEKIRQVILDKDHYEMKAHTEALLYAAARAQHIDEVIRPALAENKIILCDRYIDSSFAYQGYARKLGMEYVTKINTYALDFMPKLTFYIDLDPCIGQDRIKNRKNLNRLDIEKLDFHNIVREGFLKVASNFPNRIVVIDGSKSIDEIYQAILARIEAIL